jgi:hypothetical protein
VDVFQASGPGGQKRNRKYSAVRITHLPSGYSATSTGTRDQHINKRDAIRKIKLQLAVNIRDEKIKIDRQVVSTHHPDYPLWVSLLFDSLYENNFDIKITASGLGLTTSKLLKLIYNDRMLWDVVTVEREKRELKNLLVPK